MKRLLGTTAALGALAITPLSAQEAFDLDEIVVSGALTALPAQPLSRTGATVEVLEAEDLLAAPTSLNTALAQVPGLTFSADGGLGSSTTLRIRGLSPSYVAVRLDGIDITDPSGVQTRFNFGGLTGAGLGRIEVIKGAQSALYGSEAIGGVIDISTRRGEQIGFSGYARAGGGSFETYFAETGVTQRTEDGQLSFNLSRTISDGISSRAGDDEEDGYQQTFATLTGDYAVSDTVTLGFSAFWRDEVIEFDRSAFDNSGESTGLQQGARVFAQIEAFGASHELAYAYFDTDREDPGGFTREFLGDRRQLSYLGTAEVGSSTLSFGLDRTEETLRNDAFSGEDVTVAALAEAVLRPIDTLDIALSLRYDESDDFGGATTGRVAVAWQAGPETTLRAVAGTGFRAPSLFERFSAFGDPDLEVEESLSLELGVEQRFGAEGFVKATAFYAEVDNLIDFDPNATACGSGFGCYNQVEGTTRTRGIELSGAYGLLDGAATLRGAYTYTDAETEGERLVRVPRHDLVLGIEGRIAEGLTGSLDVQHVADVLPSAFAPADNKVGDYTLVNAGLTWAITDEIDAVLRIENLTDEDYETAGGFNTPGRAAYVSLATRF